MEINTYFNDDGSRCTNEKGEYMYWIEFSYDSIEDSSFRESETFGGVETPWLVTEAEFEQLKQYMIELNNWKDLENEKERSINRESREKEFQISSFDDLVRRATEKVDKSSELINKEPREISNDER